MKLLHAVHSFPPEFVGGTQAYLEALASEQQRRGHDVLVVAGSERPPDPGPAGLEPLREERHGVRIVRLGHDDVHERYSIDYRLPRIESLYRELLAEERPDLVHVHHYLNLGAPLVGAARELGIPALVTLHDFTVLCPRIFLIRPCGAFCGDDMPIPLDLCQQCCGLDYDGSRDELQQEFALRRRFFDAELGNAARVLVPSSATVELLRGSGILSGAAGQLEPEIVPLGLLRELKPEPRKAGPDGALRLVFFGGVAPVKGVDLLLSALHALGEEARQRVSLLILGGSTDPALDERLEQLSRGLSVSREKEFDQRRLERLPQQADLAIFPGTAAETYSIVVDEALALGLPVLVSDRGAASERAGAAGVVVRAGDVADLTRTLEDLLRHPERLAALRDAACSATFTLADHATRLDQLYAEVLAEDTTPTEPDLELERRRLLLRDQILGRLRQERAALPAGPAVSAEDPAPEEFDPSFRFRPLRPFESVPGGRVVILAPHPDDEIIGAGGALALHAARGDEVIVIHLTDGSGGDRDDRTDGAIARVRKAEARAAGELLGVTRFEALDFPDGGLRPGGAFAAGLTGRLEQLRPDVVYLPSPFEHHPDHRATLHLGLSGLEALATGGLDPAVMVYEVNEPQQAAFLLDITAVLDRKERALRCFESQNAYMDIVTKTLTANRARTVNVDLGGVEAAEAYTLTRSKRLRTWVDQVIRLHRLLDDMEAMEEMPESRANPAAEVATSSVPVTCVISTWNKKDDVRENLLALTRQTRPPAEIVVVDNASTDGTAEMIRAEFAAVHLIEMPHDRFGACETFNVGFRAATQPFTAIMDDDVAAPPEWLARLVERMEREPETTAMVSSKVIEPGMPEAFLDSDEVNRERYMATFRGCGSLARTEVLARAGLYDERFFIYGNERDLSARILGLGYRILQYPRAEIFHKTPFGLKAGKRSLYYHVRNFWLYAFKNCTWSQVFRAGFTLSMRGLGFGKKDRHASDATGTIGIEKSLKETPGGKWIAIKATLAAVLLLPYCLKHRSVCRAPDFEPPV